MSSTGSYCSINSFIQPTDFLETNFVIKYNFEFEVSAVHEEHPRTVVCVAAV